VTNYRGDVMRIVDENGATVASYSYDPWGKVLSASEDAAVSGQPLGYAGYYYDKETNLYYLQARYYDPETARFISRDPDSGDQDDPMTQNGYTYANDNPVMNVDPDGNRYTPAKIVQIIAQAYVWARALGYVVWSEIKSYARSVIKKLLSRGSVKLSMNDVHHIINRHSVNSMKNQIPYLLKKMPRSNVEQMLSKRTFFNKTWSNEKIRRASQIAYNKLLKQGKIDGEYIVRVYGEDLRVFLRNGELDSVTGLHQYTLKDFGF
jgi:RHS repeat-associated protein